MTDSIIATQRTRDRTFFRFCAWFSSRPRRHLPGSTRPRSERFASRPAPLGKTGRTTACFHHNSTFSDGLQALSLRFPLVFVPFRLLSDYFRSFNLPAGAGTFHRAPGATCRAGGGAGQREQGEAAQTSQNVCFAMVGEANFAKHYILRMLARENRAYQARRPACLRAGTLPTREAQERGSPAPGATATCERRTAGRRSRARYERPMQRGTGGGGGRHHHKG